MSVKLAVGGSVARRLRDEVDDTAVDVGSILRAVWTTQHLDGFQTRRFDQTEERADTATLSTRRITHTIYVDGDVSSS